MIEQFLLSKFISPGVKIELEAMERIVQEDTEKKVFDSRVVDILDEDRIEVLMPMEKTKLILLPINGAYQIRFNTGKGLFQCATKVVNRYKNGSVYLLEMQLTSPLQKYQRREFYRFMCTLDMQIRELTDNERRGIDKNKELILDKNQTNYSATIVDLSGGGLRFTSATPFEPKSLVLCEYTLNRDSGVKDYHIAGELLSCKRLENNPGMYEQRVRFICLKQKEREENIQFIFEEERKRRQRAH